MAGTLPVLTSRGGAPCQYPVTRIIQFQTTVLAAKNGSEQRWASGLGIARFVLTYTRIPAFDRDALDTFAASQKGAFDSTWSFVFAGTTYTNLAFESDIFEWVEQTEGRFSATIKIWQTVTGGLATGAGTDYPVLASGAMTQFPFARRIEYYTARNNLESGKQYSHANYEAGMTGFPSRGLYGWTLGYPSISEDDALSREQHFIQKQGMFGQFNFTDPKDGAVYGKTRYGMDALELKYLQLGQVATSVVLKETN